VKTKSGYPVAMTQTYERPRLLVLDILESYAREREIHVVLERVNAQQGWVCTLSSDEAAVQSIGTTARAAIMGALKQEGVSVPQW
jgi:hypothetical protein